MDALFGIPMNTIMIVLLGALGICLSAIAYVALRRRIIFMMGLRNVPRRVAQTVLIVAGLMLSTLIISAAFTTGDTVDYSVSNEAYKLLGHVDITVNPESQRDNGAPLGSRDISGEQYRAFLSALDRAPPEDVDGYMGVLFEEVPVINPRSGLSEPSVTFVGLDESRLSAFPDVISASSGKVLDVSALAADAVLVNRSAADELEAVPGDRVQVYVRNEPHEFVVADVVEDRVLSGTRQEQMREGVVTGLDRLHSLFGHQRVDFVAVSIEGGVRDTLDRTEAVEAALEEIIAREELDLAMGDSKKDGVEMAEEFGNFMTTFFLLLGLFSIGAGLLLIVMIFVMLAAERKSEMGMARAVGMQRRHLIEMFMSEGTAYNVVAAMVGALLGVLVAFGLAYAMQQIFSEFGISVTPHVTARAFLVAYSMGVVLTFITVTFASWRVSNLNIVRAIRDIPEPGGRQMGWRGLGIWTLLALLGGFLFWTGLQSDLAFPFALGFSLMSAGTAIWLRRAGLPERPVFTTMGVLLLVIWGLVAGGRLRGIFGPLEGDIEMFFLSGVAMVTASTYVIIYNSDIVLTLLSRMSGLFGAVLPAVRTAVAYPLHNRFRTGMTLAMISLVVFALTMMSTMNLNFDKLFLSDESRGGWDIQVQENPNNPITDLRAALAAAGSDAAEEFRAVGRLDLPGIGMEPANLRQDPEGEYDGYIVKGANAEFIDDGQVRLNARADGFESDEEVWQALKSRDDVAVIDGFTVQSGFGDEGFSLSGIPEGAKVFDPVRLEIQDPVSSGSAEVEVIAVIDFGSSSNFMGVFISESLFREVFGDPELSLHYVALEDPDNSDRIAKEIESTLLTAGVQAESLKEIADRNQALFRNFFYLMQAFMGLGLFVGIAAVGVISFRTVVERRQQIGMLRAIGFKRGMVALSFLIESSFVTVLGVLSGIGLALWLSYFLVSSDEFPAKDSGYYVPWLEIAVIAAFTFIASLVMTWIPSRQAASIPTAEALRYE